MQICDPTVTRTVHPLGTGYYTSLEGIKWSKVPSNMKEYYWEEFEVQFNAFSLSDKC